MVVIEHYCFVFGDFPFFVFFLKDLLILCMYLFCLVYMCVPRVCAWCLKGSEDDVGCKLSCECLRLNPGLLQEQQVLLDTEPSLQHGRLQHGRLQHCYCYSEGIFEENWAGEQDKFRIIRELGSWAAMRAVLSIIRHLSPSRHSVSLCWHFSH